MKLLPLFVRVKVCAPRFWMPTLYLPVFLLWPVFFALLFLIFVVGLLVVVMFDIRSISRFFKTFGGVYRILCEARGTKVDVESIDAKVFVAID